MYCVLNLLTPAWHAFDWLIDWTNRSLPDAWRHA